MMFWTVVVFCLFRWVVDVYGTNKDTEVARFSLTGSTTLPTVTPTEDDGIKLVDWLTKYGYLPPPDPSTGQLQAWTTVTQALKNMQRFAGLDETGFIDAETIQLMQTPRCSLPDDDEQTFQASGDTLNQRMKRAASSWKRKNINWRLRSYPASSKLSREMIRSLVFYALRVWADPTPLEFHEVRGAEGTDLQVDFWRGSHGDGYPFDGVGGSVGHAFFPSDPERAGGVHLDAEEPWAFRQPAGEGMDLFTVLVHEMGHALGLSHSSAKHSVMLPYYQGPLGDPLQFSLGPLDLKLITALYGKRGNHIPTESSLLISETQFRHRHGGVHKLTHMFRHWHSTSDSSLDRCNTSFDAIAKIRGEIFFFKGQSMWRVNRDGLVSTRAVPVQRLWTALPHSLPPLRAVLERHTDHAIIFIAGSQVWSFRDLSLQDGYPQPLSSLGESEGEEEWRGLHWDPLQEAVWGSANEHGMEGASEAWSELIKGGVSGIIAESNQRESTGEINGPIYLFKGNYYWKFSQPGSAPEEGFPQLLASDWLDCPQPSSFSPDDISLISRYDHQDLKEEKSRRFIDKISHQDKKAIEKLYPEGCPCQNSAGLHSGSILQLIILFMLCARF